MTDRRDIASYGGARKKEANKQASLFAQNKKNKIQNRKNIKKQGQAVRKVLMAPLLAALLAFIVTNI